MSISGQNGDAPLLLFQMLEEEYQTLHGPLPDHYKEAKQKILCRTPLENNESQVNETLVSELYRCIHAKQPAALCLSGGGIRSATFGLGVLQGLARRGLLEQFHYLSTVSGGGYLGSWLTSWIHRKALPAVLEELRNPPQSETESRTQPNSLPPRVQQLPHPSIRVALSGYMDAHRHLPAQSLRELVCVVTAPDGDPHAPPIYCDDCGVHAKSALACYPPPWRRAHSCHSCSCLYLPKPALCSGCPGRR